MKKKFIFLLVLILAVLTISCPNDPGGNGNPETAPNAPVVSGPSVVNITRPTWTWTMPENADKSRVSINNTDWIQITDNSVTSYTPNYDLENGTYNFSVQVSNSANLWSESGLCITVIDLTASDAPIVTSDEQNTSNRRPVWNWTNPEGSIDFRYRINNSEWVLLGGTTETSYTPESELAEGEYTFEVQALDEAGNWSASGLYTVTVTVTAPNAPVVSGPSVVNITRPTWTWTMPENADKSRVSINNTDWIQITDNSVTSYTPNYDLENGTYNFSVQVSNSANLWSESGLCITVIDLTASDAPIVTSDEQNTSNRRPVWNWTNPEGSIDFRYRINNSEWVLLGGTTETSYTPESELAEGEYTFEVQAIDEAGNWSVSGLYTVTVDVTAPNVPSVTSDELQTRNKYPVWNWNIPEGAVDCRYRINNGEWVNIGGITITSYTPSSELAVGLHTLEVQAVDQAGNWSNSGICSVEILRTHTSTILERYTAGDSGGRIRLRMRMDGDELRITMIGEPINFNLMLDMGYVEVKVEGDSELVIQKQEGSSGNKETVIGQTSTNSIWLETTAHGYTMIYYYIDITPEFTGTITVTYLPSSGAIDRGFNSFGERATSTDGECESIVIHYPLP